MKVLVTGAFGMVGRKLVDELETHGHELVLLDRVPPEQATMFVAGSEKRQPAPFRTKWPCRQDDVTDPDAMVRAVEGMDAVIHLAAAVTGLPEHGCETFRVNCTSGWATLDACRKGGVTRYLCASSINAFGTIYWRLSGKPSPYTSMPLNEDFEPVPEDAYSLSKHVNELTCAAFPRAFGVTAAAFRFAGVWSRKASTW